MLVGHELLKWLLARDVFLGRNYQQQDLEKGLWIACGCQHADAKWLVSVFPNGAPRTVQKAKKAFLACGDDAKALCFSAACGSYKGGEKMVQRGRMRRAAELGYALAQAEMCALATRLEKQIRWGEAAYARDEREGAFQLSRIEEWKSGRDRRRALEFAADRKLVEAQFYLGLAFPPDNPIRYKWWETALNDGYCQEPFVSGFYSLHGDASSERRKFDEDGSGQVVFAMGGCFVGRFDVERHELAGDELNCSELGDVLRLAKLYEDCCTNARIAIETWQMIAMRNKSFINKDLRLIVSRLVWADRSIWTESEGMRQEPYDEGRSFCECARNGRSQWERTSLKEKR